MKKLLPALLIALFALGCKKDQQAFQLASATDTLTTGKTVTTPAGMSITAMSPTVLTAGTEVTITGKNFGSSAAAVRVLFSGVLGIVRSVSPTEIKVTAPDCHSGTITVVLNDNVVTGPAFLIGSPLLTAPYTGGDVILYTQAEVNAFVNVNKGRLLAISGDLTIMGLDITDLAGLKVITSVSGTLSIHAVKATEAAFLNDLTAAGHIMIQSAGFTQLHFDHITGFKGSIVLNALLDLKQVSFSNLTTISYLTIWQCFQLTDLSFLENLTSADGISIDAIRWNKLALDKLLTINKGGLTITGTLNGSTISFRSLTSITGDVSFNGWQQIGNASAAFSALTAIHGNLTINSQYNTPALNSLDFPALSAITGMLKISNTSLKDMSGFAALKILGALNLSYNSALTDLRGLEHLRSLDITTAVSSGYVQAITERVNGLCIAGNTNLTSLDGLQNLTATPIIYISGNSKLNAWCALKNAPLATLKAAPNFAYQFKYDSADMQPRNTSVSALTLTNNGNYVTTQNALDAINACH